MLADWIAIGAVLIVVALGALIGFGKGLKFFTSGIIGIVISVFVCYCIGGLILDIDAIRNLLGDLAGHWSHIEWLKNIHLEIIIYYIALFIIVQIVRILLTKVVSHVLETDILLIKVINKIGGAVLFLCAFVLFALLIFQIIYWIGGTTAVDFHNWLAGSWLKLDDLFINNPLVKMVNYIRAAAAI